MLIQVLATLVFVFGISSEMIGLPSGCSLPDAVVSPATPVSESAAALTSNVPDRVALVVQRITAGALPGDDTEIGIRLHGATYSGPPLYAIIVLPTLGSGISTARAVNNRGELGGAAGNGVKAWVPVIQSATGELRDIPIDGYPTAEIFGLNDRGECEVALDRYGLPPMAGFISVDREVIEVGDFGGGSSGSSAINNHGEISAGSSYTNGGIGRGAFWSRETGLVDIGDIDPFGDTTTVAYDINDSGVIVGYSMHPDYGVTRAITWQDGVLTPIPGLLETKDSVAELINDHAEILVAGWISETQGWTAVRDRDGGIQPLKFRFMKPTYWKALNNNRQLLSHLQLSGSFKPQMWYDVTKLPVLLEDLIPPHTQWKLDSGADDMNDHMQIAGNGTYEGYWAGYLATPVHPTIKMTDIVPGRAGATNGFRISNAPPNSRVYVCYSSYGGGAFIPGCSNLENVMQLDDPKVVRQVITDAEGKAEVRGVIPSQFAGQIYLFQAVIPETCEISNLVVQRFE